MKVTRNKGEVGTKAEDVSLLFKIEAWNMKAMAKVDSRKTSPSLSSRSNFFFSEIPLPGSLHSSLMTFAALS